MRSLIVLALLALPLAACGGSSGSSTEPSTNLTVTVKPDKNGPEKTHTVTCPGDDVCAELEALPASAFDPVPAGMACTQIYGGPEEATVQGTFQGQPVDATFSRINGCEIARWDRVQLLFKG